MLRIPQTGYEETWLITPQNLYQRTVKTKFPMFHCTTAIPGRIFIGERRQQRQRHVEYLQMLKERRKERERRQARSRRHLYYQNGRELLLTLSNEIFG